MLVCRLGRPAVGICGAVSAVVMKSHLTSSHTLFSSSVRRMTENNLSSRTVSPVYLPVRFSQVSSFKEEGYFRLPDLKRIVIDSSVYEVRTMRGSGPGGQGTNSSSNKVELRVDLNLLAGFFDEETMAALIANESGKHVSADHTTLVVSCHEHRSALQNKEGCLLKLREMLQAASWVPPVERDPIERPTHIVTQQKQKRRVKSNINRMKRSARKGTW